MKQLLSVVFLLSTLVNYAQEYEVLITNISDDMGIDVPATFGIAEDRYGFIWFGTVDGLYRYDGHAMRVYRNDKDDETSLSNNTIRTILMDSVNDKIWIGTQGGGLNVFDIKKQTFERFEHHDNDLNSLADNSIWELMMDAEGAIWIGMENKKVDRFVPDENMFYHVNFEDTAKVFNGSCTIRMLFNDSFGNVWIGTDNHGLYKIDSAGTIQHYYQNDKEVFSLKNNFILSAIQDNSGVLWVATFGAGIAKYDAQNDVFIHLQNEPNQYVGSISNLTYSMVSGDADKLWVGSEYGLSLIDVKTGKSKYYVQMALSSNGLSDNRIRFLFKDSNGIIWIGTEAGVDKLVQQNNFRIFRHIIDNGNSLPIGIVRSIFKDAEGILWIGLIDKGLVKYDATTQEFTDYRSADNLNGDIVCYQVSSIFEDSENNLWVCDWEKGLLRFDRQKECFIPEIDVYSEHAPLCDNRIQVIKEDSPGVLWIGTEMGIQLYNFKTKQIQNIINEPNNPLSISGNSIQSQAFEIDNNGNLWVGTWSKGLNYIEIESRNPLKYKAHRYLQPDNNQWLNASNVISLHLQNDSILWIGTFGGGLIRMNINTHDMTSYESEDGLPNNTIFAISQGVDQSLWLSTDFGLSNFIFEKQSFYNYEKNDGLQDNHFFWGAAYTAKDGELFFGGISGLNSFYPENINVNKLVDAVYITDIKVFNQTLESANGIEFLDEIELDYDQNYLTFTFSILNYFNPNKDIVEVKLDGLEHDWNEIGKQRTISYSNLPPGSYLFNVKVHGLNHLDSHRTKVFKLLIKAPWWQNWWARILQIILFFVIVIGAYRIRLNVLLKQKHILSVKIKQRTSEILEKNIKLKQQNAEIGAQKEELFQKNMELSRTLKKLSEVKEQVIQSEKMASLGVLAAGVAHEINNPLNFIMGGLIGIEQHFKESKCAKSDEPRVFYQAIKEGVDRTAAIVASLNQFSLTNDANDEICDVHQIIENCILILGNQFKNRITLHKIFDESMPSIIGNSGKLHQVILNVLSNAEQAIVETGSIEIHTKQINSNIELKFQDTGEGISKQDLPRITEPFFTTKDPGKGTGLGLSIGYKIIQEHGGQMTFESEQNNGTLVTIILPIKQG